MMLDVTCVILDVTCIMVDHVSCEHVSYWMLKYGSSYWM